MRTSLFYGVWSLQHDRQPTMYGSHPVLEGVPSNGGWANCTPHGWFWCAWWEGARPMALPHAHPATTFPTSPLPLPRPRRPPSFPPVPSSLHSLAPLPCLPLALFLFCSQGNRLCSEVGLRSSWLPGSHCRAPTDTSTLEQMLPALHGAQPVLRPAPASAPKPDSQATQEAGTATFIVP